MDFVGYDPLETTIIGKGPHIFHIKTQNDINIDGFTFVHLASSCDSDNRKASIFINGPLQNVTISKYNRAKCDL